MASTPRNFHPACNAYVKNRDIHKNLVSCPQCILWRMSASNKLNSMLQMLQCKQTCIPAPNWAAYHQAEICIALCRGTRQLALDVVAKLSRIRMSKQRDDNVAGLMHGSKARLETRKSTGITHTPMCSMPNDRSHISGNNNARHYTYTATTACCDMRHM